MSPAGAGRPQVHPTASVAGTAVLRGNVVIGAHTRVLAGAVLTADGGSVQIGSHVIVMEHAVLRGAPRDPLTVGDHCLVGPHASVTGAAIGDEVFLATGASVFNGARIGAGSEIRINGIVHLRTVLPPRSTVPIGWVAVGDPARILPPGAHEEIWELQRRLDFPGHVFGLGRESRPDGRPPMVALTERYSRFLATLDET